MKKLLKNLGEMEDFARDRLKNLRPGAHAALLLLSGDLGAGKTAFTKAVAKLLGVKEDVTSPTFVLEKVYKLPPAAGSGVAAGGHISHLIHIDAYRLESGRELAALGFAEMAANPGNLILLEWPERVAEILPKDAATISFRFVDEGTREVEWK